MKSDPGESEAASSCEAVRPLLGDSLVGAPADDRTNRRAIEHLARCAPCRALQAASDPTAIFLALRGEAVPESLRAGFKAGLLARIRERSSGRSAFFALPRLAYVAAPLAVLLVLGLTLFTLRSGRVVRQTRGGVELPSAAFPSPGAAASASGLEERAADRPSLEHLSFPDARVYEFLVGPRGEETPIYLVVDESINI